ncbi:actin-bundling T4SS effector WalE1 family protein [Wolbachia endosymbiont of Ctenocephalides felis wCfeT]|uniref:actin-bundling T4SS effector WalE1 family protein n=1 Tax=Wolbachia endosymbiont of Ctenocephalides felis wCfeT TaxID=2732593 RepID=UPI001446266A|nr:hypothetical protein [Wolbachia endosymbiont of Ctenocephalides felis wCfeT]
MINGSKQIDSDTIQQAEQAQENTLTESSKGSNDTKSSNNPSDRNNAFTKLFGESIKGFSQWPLQKKVFAVSAAVIIFDAALLLSVAALTIATPIAVAALTLFFTAKAIEYAFKMVIWSAEKTYQGAKKIGQKAKEAVGHGVNKVKEGTSRALDRSGSFLKEIAHSNEYSMESAFVQDSLEKHGIKEVVNDTIKIIKANNSSVPSKIKSAIQSAIKTKTEELQGKYVPDDTGKDRSLEVKGDQKKQSRMVDRLEETLTSSILDTKQLSLVTEIFSQYKDEIRNVLDDYSKNPDKYPKEPTFSRKISGSISSSFSSLKKRSASTSSGSSLSGVSSISADSTVNSEAGLVSPEKPTEVTTSSSFKNKLKSLLVGTKTPKKAAKDTSIEYQRVSDSDSISLTSSGSKSSATINSAGYRSAGHSRQSSRDNASRVEFELDSGRGSSPEEKSNSFVYINSPSEHVIRDRLNSLNKTGLRADDVSPSTHISVAAEVHQPQVVSK